MRQGVPYVKLLSGLGHFRRLIVSDSRFQDRSDGQGI